MERIGFSSNQNIGEGESNFDEKDMSKKRSNDQSCIRKRNTTYKIGTLVSTYLSFLTRKSSL